jgi:hypothetical protein
MLGTNIFRCEVTNIANFGFWLIIDNQKDNWQEYFIPFSDYPSFKKAKINEIHNVKMLSVNQIHWPDLDIDIEVDALRNPEDYPLIFKKD